MSSDWAADKAKELLATMRGMDEVDAGLFLSGALRGVRDAERFRLAKETPTATVETPPGFRKQGLRVHVGGISWWMDLPESLATALRDAARVPEGCVRTADGVDRKVLGTLPLTADGCVVMPGEMVYVPDYAFAWTLQPEQTVAVATQDSDGYWRDMVVGECYSTREAAEAALKALARLAELERQDTFTPTQPSPTLVSPPTAPPTTEAQRDSSNPGTS